MSKNNHTPIPEGFDKGVFEQEMKRQTRPISLTGDPVILPMKLEFQYQITAGGLWMLVEYDSYSRDRNLIQDITLFDFPIDVPALRMSHKDLFKDIEAAMANNAATRYDDLDEHEPVGK